MGIIGDGDIEVVMVGAVLRVAVVIRSNSSICMFGGREAVLVVVVVVILFLATTTTTTITNTTTITTIINSFIAIQHTPKYCTPGDGGERCICQVVMEVVVMVGCWW